MCGAIDRSAPWAEKLLRSDPLIPFTHWIAGCWLNLMAGHFEQALPAIRRAHEMDSGAAPFRTAYALTLTYLDRTDEALAILDGAPEELPGREVWAAVGRVLARALRGEKEEALKHLTDDLKSDARTDMLYSWLLADCYAVLEQLGDALDWLENAVRGGFLNYPFLAKQDPLLAPLRTEPDFTDLMEHLKERWTGLEA
jgi:tetratricopeptide (TPR) repeat protein